jgi:hypothetical protein
MSAKSDITTWIRRFHDDAEKLCNESNLAIGKCKMLLYLQLLPEFTETHRQRFLSMFEEKIEKKSCNPN